MRNMIRRKDVIKRNIHGEIFLIDITQNYFDDECFLYQLNEMGAFIWEQLSNPISTDELVEVLKENISDEISDEELLRDVKVYVESLKQEGFWEE